jgi:hypothetical protein
LVKKLIRYTRSFAIMEIQIPINTDSAEINKSLFLLAEVERAKSSCTMDSSREVEIGILLFTLFPGIVITRVKGGKLPAKVERPEVCRVRM